VRREKRPFVWACLFVLMWAFAFIFGTPFALLQAYGVLPNVPPIRFIIPFEIIIGSLLLYLWWSITWKALMREYLRNELR
jgi:hypothetical protein